MADVKKDQERDELFRRIYKIATDLVHAGHVAEWDFKSYVLGTMFYRYISENFTAYINEGEHAAGNKDFDYAKMSDADAEPAREGLVQEKGFFILPSELFCNVLAQHFFHLQQQRTGTAGWIIDLVDFRFADGAEASQQL